MKAIIIPDTMRSISITGYLLPFIDWQPVRVSMPNETTAFVTVFSTEEKLREHMEQILPGHEYQIKKITDGQEFCQSLWEQSVRIMLDPYIVDGQKTHWTEIMKDENTC